MEGSMYCQFEIQQNVQHIMSFRGGTWRHCVEGEQKNRTIDYPRIISDIIFQNGNILTQQQFDSTYRRDYF